MITFAEKILQLEKFKKQFLQLSINSVALQFPMLEPEPEVQGFAKIDLNYLLFIASILAQSKLAECQDAALRISQFCLSINESSSQQKNAAAVILDTLTNRPSLNLALERSIIDRYTV